MYFHGHVETRDAFGIDPPRRPEFPWTASDTGRNRNVEIRIAHLLDPPPGPPRDPECQPWLRYRYHFGISEPIDQFQFGAGGEFGFDG